MSQRTLCPRFAVLEIALLVALVTPSVPQTKAPLPETAIVRQVDHIMVNADSIAHAKALWSLFTEQLQLPVAWPPAQYQGFFSGGVSFGNVNLEFGYQVGDLPPGGSNPEAAQAWIAGLGLEPEPLPAALRGLDGMHVRHGRPYPYTADVNGKKETLWTTVGLDEISSDRMVVFLCEYAPAVFQMSNPPFGDLNARRKDLQDHLSAKGGGPLGIIAVKEIVLGISSYDRGVASWQKLLHAKSENGGEWKPAEGPRIRFIAADTTAAQTIIVRVASVSRARGYLERQKLLGETKDRGISLDRKKLMGVDLRLTE